MTNLEELVQDIERFETIISEWDENQKNVVIGLKLALKSLHYNAFRHLIENMKPESISSLLDTNIDKMVYKLLLDNELIELPKEPLLQRLHRVIDKIRPYLQKYHENIELVAFKPPDTLEISLMGNASHDNSVNLNLLHKIKKSVQCYCPEITKIVAVNRK